MNKKLPEECRSAKHVLEHILTQVAEFKKFNQASSAACTTHSHSHLTCVRCLMTHTPHPSPTHTPRSPFTFPPTLHSHLTCVCCLMTHTPHSPFTFPPTLLTHPSPSHPLLTHPSPSYPHFTHPSPSHPHSSLTLHPPTHSSLTLHPPTHSSLTLQPPTHSSLTLHPPTHTPHSPFTLPPTLLPTYCDHLIVLSPFQEPFGGGVAPTPVQDDS